jgi:hypothetical protein
MRGPSDAPVGARLDDLELELRPHRRFRHQVRHRLDISGSLGGHLERGGKLLRALAGLEPQRAVERL